MRFRAPSQQRTESYLPPPPREQEKKKLQRESPTPSIRDNAGKQAKNSLPQQFSGLSRSCLRRGPQHNAFIYRERGSGTETGVMSKLSKGGIFHYKI